MLIIYGFCSTGGYALLASSKAIMGDIFIPALPHLIDANFFSTYAILLGFGSLIGRIGYSIASDTLGRRNMYHLYSLAGGSLFFALPSLIKLVIETGSVAAFYGFVASTFLISSLLGGTLPTFPAFSLGFLWIQIRRGNIRKNHAWSIGGDIRTRYFDFFKKCGGNERSERTYQSSRSINILK